MHTFALQYHKIVGSQSDRAQVKQLFFLCCILTAPAKPTVHFGSPASLCSPLLWTIKYVLAKMLRKETYMFVSFCSYETNEITKL